MGRKINVNPNHYKTAGRERPGQDIVQEVHKQKYTQAKAGRGQGAPKLMPGAKPLRPTHRARARRLK